MCGINVRAFFGSLEEEVATKKKLPSKRKRSVKPKSSNNKTKRPRQRKAHIGVKRKLDFPSPASKRPKISNEHGVSSAVSSQDEHKTAAPSKDSDEHKNVAPIRVPGICLYYKVRVNKLLGWGQNDCAPAAFLQILRGHLMRHPELRCSKLKSVATIIAIIDQFNAAWNDVAAEQKARAQLYSHLQAAAASPTARYDDTTRVYDLNRADFISCPPVLEDMLGLIQYERQKQEVPDYVLHMTYRCDVCDKRERHRLQTLVEIPKSVMENYDQLSDADFVSQTSRAGPMATCTCTTVKGDIQVGPTTAPMLLNFIASSGEFRPISLKQRFHWRTVADVHGALNPAVSYQLIGVVYYQNRQHFSADVCYGTDFTVWHHYDGFHQSALATYIGTTPISQHPIVHLIYERV